MPKPRKKINKGLPKRWSFRKGAYYYEVPKGQESAWDGKRLFPLGKTLPEAYQTWADRIGNADNAQTVGDLLDQYTHKVIPTKAPTTQASYRKCLPPLRRVFGHMPLTAVEPHHIYAYYRKRAKPVQAKHEVKVLSQAYSAAVEWGYIKAHPFKGQVRLPNKEKDSPRVVTDADVSGLSKMKPTRKKGGILAVQAYIRLSELTGLRRADMLCLRLENLQEDGIYIQTRKKKKVIIIEWTPALRQAVDQALSVRPNQKSDFVFCTRFGKGYWDEKKGNASGWDSIWHRALKKAKREGAIKETFGMHDMRSKAADKVDEAHAQKLLAHADPRTTRKHYRRAATRVKPTE